MIMCYVGSKVHVLNIRRKIGCIIIGLFSRTSISPNRFHASHNTQVGFTFNPCKSICFQIWLYMGGKFQTNGFHKIQPFWIDEEYVIEYFFEFHFVKSHLSMYIFMYIFIHVMNGRYFHVNMGRLKVKIACLHNSYIITQMTGIGG